jgi:hypothetical protein
MVSKKVKDLRKDPQCIEGIYNYCDRWCEKCPFTSRCLNYKIYEERFGNLKDKDVQNEEFCNRFAEMMKETFEMLKESMDEWGVSIEDFCEEVITDEDADEQFLVILAGEYSTKVTTWFEEPYYINEDRANILERNSIEIKEIGDIILWYQYQIEVKLRRAFSSKDLSDEISMRDMNGSAKVALIGCERSIGAWGAILEYIPERKESIKEMLSLLHQILEITENTFPAARAFIRPGFDE